MEDTEEDRGLLTEVYAKHGRSAQPESRAVCSVLGAVLEVLKSEGMSPTPTALFAALMSSLEGSQTQQSLEVTTAMCTVLDPVLARVPNVVLRSKFVMAAEVMSSIASKHQQDPAAIKAALGCITHLLAAVDPADWPSGARLFNILLSFSLDRRPKVRKRAQGGMVEVLAAVQNSPALLPASDAMLMVCQRVLPAPEVAARAAAAGSGKKRQQLEQAISTAVTDALHLLGLLKQTILLLSDTAVVGVCELLLKLYFLRQPLLSRHATEVLVALTGSSSSHISPATLADLLRAVLEQEASWDRTETETMLTMVRLLENGFIRLAELDAGRCGVQLPRGVAALVPLLTAPQQELRFAASQCLRNLIHDCIDAAAVSSSVSQAALPSRAPTSLQSVIATVAGSLSSRYEDAWLLALPVVSELLTKLGRRGARLAEGLLNRVGELCAGIADAEGAGDAAAAECGLAAEAAMGAALRSLGPEAVLKALPLHLQEGLDGTAEARTWLLPVMQRHVRGAEMGFWARRLLPEARALGDRAARAAADPGARTQELNCRALEAQLWAALPSFASWPTDMADAFKAHARDIGAAFRHRPDLRPPISLALQRLCQQNRGVLRAAGATQLLGPGDPPGNVGDDEELRHGEDGELVEQDEGHRYSVDTATQNVKVLRETAKQWLPLMFNAFQTSPAEERGTLARAISAYACVAAPDTVAQFFRQIITKLLQATQGGEGAEDGDACGTYLEMALCLAGGLDASGIEVLYKAAKSGLQTKDAAFQKKAYKVLAYICEQRPDVTRPQFQDILETLIAGLARAASAAKRYRLRCVKAIIMLLERDPDLDFDIGSLDAVTTKEQKRRQLMSTLVAEIILCVKEVNQKARLAAYELLVELGHAMNDARPSAPALLNQDEDMGGASLSGEQGGLHMLFTMVLGGLVGATPHMMAASLMALARLLYEFGAQLHATLPQLLPAVLLLFRSKSREVIKAALGFIKVVAGRMPVEMLTPQLGPILEGILLWAHDSKNKFKLKVRLILERLARRCGFDALAAVMPQADRKLLTHIRKERHKKDRRAAAGTSQMEVDERDETRSRASKATRASKGRMAAKSEWAASNVFSEDGEQQEAGAGPSSGAARTLRNTTVAGGRTRRQGHDSQGRLLNKGDAEPLDLLDAGTSRQLVRSAARPARGGSDGDDDFMRDDAGKMVIKEEAWAGGKRKRRGEGDSDGSDFEDLRARVADLDVALAANASVRSGAMPRSLAGRSQGGRTAGGRTNVSTTTRSGKAGKEHTGDRFKAKGAGGDVKRGSKVEPYAYWPFDRKMLNRRPDKRAAAKAGLEGIVKSARKGARQGVKAKRQRRS